MNIAILGYGSQGASALKYWNTPEHTVTVCDANEHLELPDGVSAQLGGGYLLGLDRFDLVVRSPSIHPRVINGVTPDKVTTNTNEFMRVCPTKNVIGVTGTKGKGTTSTLIARMLEAAGHTVHLGGNIGTPPLEMLADDIAPEDWVVLELANFQLIDLKHSPTIAVCLMVEPEHLDWHTDMAEYIGAKQQLFARQTEQDMAVYYALNELSQQVVSVTNARKVPYFSTPGSTVRDDAIMLGETVICNVAEVAMIGKHNWQNICAATTAVWDIVGLEAIRSTIQTMAGLPYRIELRREVDGVRYYNDSFATAPGAAIAAIDAISGPKVLILGGHDRGLPLDTLAHRINDGGDVRTVVAIGASRERLAGALRDSGFSNIEMCDAQNMSKIVTCAQSFAQTGDAVVLSPSFASFDMFKNFEVRGNAFNAAVEAL